MISEENQPARGTAEKPARLLGIRSRLLKTILLSFLAIFSLAVAWKNAQKNEGKDFYQFWAIGQSLTQPGINVYANHTRSRLGAEFLEKAKQSANPDLIAVAHYRSWLQTYSSPFFYSLFRLFSTGNYETDLRNFRLLMLAGLALGIIIFCRLLNYPWAMAIMILAVLCIWFDPLASDLYVGNVNCIQFATLGIYLWTVTRLRWNYRDIAGGAILGLALAFKPNLIFVVIALVAHWLINANWRRLWSQAAGGIIGAILAIFFAAANFHDFRCWNEWLSALRTLSADNVIPVKNGNFSPIEIIYELFHLNLALPLAAIFIGMAVALFWKRRKNVFAKNETAASEAFALAVGCLLVVTASRLAWLHYYVLTIPALLFLLRPAEMEYARSRLLLRKFPLLLALIALTPVPSMIVPLDMNQQGALAAGAALLLFLSLAISPGRQEIQSCHRVKRDRQCSV